MKKDASELINLMNARADVGSYPLFWVVKDNNIVISNGKIGTATLASIIWDYSSEDKIITGDELLSMVKDQGYQLHVVVRDPRKRFRVGILEDWCSDIHYNFEQFTNKNIDVNAFVLYRLSILKSCVSYSHRHTCNWLYGISAIIDELPYKSCKIWTLDELSTLIEFLGVDPPDHKNKTEYKPQICNQFLELYDRLPNNTIKKIDRYLSKDINSYYDLLSRKRKSFRGFVILAQNTDKVDYVKCAAALAKSIKDVMPEESITLVTMDLVISDYAKYFDHIVELPFGELEPDSNWKLSNDWQVYQASPYEYTIKLEADMYIPKDISYWWDVLKDRDVVVSTTIRNYKQDISDVRVYRRFIDDNKLPNCYNAITYFKKSQLAENFYAIVRDVFEHWEQYRAILKCKTDEIVTTDWAYAIASHILGVENTTLPAFTDMSIVHMKQFINGTYTEDWTDTFVYEVLPNQIRVQTVPQMYPFHYHKKSFADNILKI